MAEDVHIVWHEPAFREMTRSPSGLVGKDLTKRGNQLRVLAAAQVGKRTGHLASSIHSYLTESTFGLEVFVGSSDSNALRHHQGTRPHDVEAHAGGMLRFRVGGRIVYARRVLNRGTRPNRYLTDNLRKVIL